MNGLEYQKELVRYKIDAERRALGARVKRLKRSVAPAAAAASFGRIAGAKLGMFASLLALFGRGPRLATWARLAAVAYLATPLVTAWLARRRARQAAEEQAE